MDDGTRPPLWGAADEPADLGALLLLLRRAHGLTQAELADAAGVPRRFVVDLENGRSTLFVQRLHAVLDALDARLVVEEPGARVAASGLPGTGASGDDAVAVGDDPDGGVPALKDLGW